MKSLRIIALLLPAAFILASCDKDNANMDNPMPHGTGGDIEFSIGFAPQTRVATDGNFAGTWEVGDEIGIFAVKHGDPLSANTSDNHIHNVRLTYTEATPGDPATGSWSLDNGVQIWFPPGGGKLDFYAYYPYDAEATDPTAIAFTVKANQNATTNIGGGIMRPNYNLSDLLTAKAVNSGNGYGKGETVALAFSHALAMVQVTVPSPGKGFGPGPDLTVTLRDVKRGATLDLSSVDETTPGSGVALATTNNNATTVTMYRLEQPGDANYETSYTYRAIVPAQSVAKDAKLFWFEHEQRMLFTDSPLAQALQMTAGQAETFERKLPATMIQTGLAPKGTFRMGETGYATPLHDVTLTKDFYMSRYQITNAQYAAFLNANNIGSDGKGSVTYYKDNFTTTVTESQTFISQGDWGVTYADGAWKAKVNYENHPVIYVTWYGAKAYADWVGGSLPTEAQWEYACRGGTTTAFYFGDAAADMGNYGWSWENSRDGTKAVGQKRSNNYGLYDMHGNVFEWCSDWYGAYGSGPDTDPTGPPTGSYRVFRGGYWYSIAQFCRSAFRNYDIPGYAYDDVGFRVVFFP